METAHQIIQRFIHQNNIDLKDFDEYVRSNRIPEEELNVYDSRYLNHLQEFVEFNSSL